MSLAKIYLESFTDGELNWSAKRLRNDERLACLAVGAVAGVTIITSYNDTNHTVTYLTSDYDNSPLISAFTYRKGKFYLNETVTIAGSYTTVKLQNCNQATGAGLGTYPAMDNTWLSTGLAFYESWNASGGTTSFKGMQVNYSSGQGSGYSPFVQKSSTTAFLVGSFEFPGTTIFGIPTRFSCILGRGGSTGTSYAQLYDHTNGNIVATVSKTTAALEIVSTNTFSNLPTGFSIFDVRIYNSSGGSQTSIYSSLLQT